MTYLHWHCNWKLFIIDIENVENLHVYVDMHLKVLVFIFELFDDDGDYDGGGDDDNAKDMWWQSLVRPVWVIPVSDSPGEGTSPRHTLTSQVVFAPDHNVL